MQTLFPCLSVHQSFEWASLKILVSLSDLKRALFVRFAVHSCGEGVLQYTHNIVRFSKLFQMSEKLAHGSVLKLVS